MKPYSLLGSAVVVGILSGLSLVAAMPVQAATTGPTVIAVHRDGAIDVPGNSTFGTIAKMSVPAGNWSLTATATLVGTDTTTRVECQLVAGTEFYKSRTLPTAQGPASSQSMVLLLAHHFAKTGTVTLKCASDGWTGDLLARDVHITAVQVGQLTDNGTTTGAGAPMARYAQDTTVRQYLDTSQHSVQDTSLPAGTWLVRATAWGISDIAGVQVECDLWTGTAFMDQSFASFGYGERNISLEGVVTVSGTSDAAIFCHDQSDGWFIYGSAISAIKIGTLKYGQLGGSQGTTGSGTPMVIGGYAGPGGITDTTSLASIGSLSLGTGSWFVTSKLSVAAGGGTPKVTCQLKIGTSASQSRVILDTGNNLYNWTAMSLTKNLSAASNATVACDQSAGSLGAFYYDLKIFALKAGTLTDTAL
jgi:hypothetical protein